MKNITYRHPRTGETVTHAAPVPGLEKAWVRAEGPAYASLRKDELVALAEARGLDTEGTKADIAARLEDHDGQPVHADA